MPRRNRSLEIKRAHIAPEVEVGPAGTFAGYASVFGVVDQGGDIVEPGAFAASLERHAAAGTMPALLYQHDETEPIGVWRVLREDSHGLWAEGELVMEMERARGVWELMRRGGLTGLSIGFNVIEAERDAHGIRHLMALDLWEVSIVTFPMCDEARIDVASVKRRPVPAVRVARATAGVEEMRLATAIARRQELLQQWMGR